MKRQLRLLQQKENRLREQIETLEMEVQTLTGKQNQIRFQMRLQNENPCIVTPDQFLGESKNHRFTPILVPCVAHFFGRHDDPDVVGVDNAEDVWTSEYLGPMRVDPQFSTEHDKQDLETFWKWVQDEVIQEYTADDYPERIVESERVEDIGENMYTGFALVRFYLVQRSK